MKTEASETTQVLDRAERIKANYANKIYCEESHLSGRGRCSWEGNPAWREYVEGEIREKELEERAEEELKDKPSRNYLLLRKRGDDEAGGDSASGGRAKTADEVYRKACAGSGGTRCFFDRSGAWSDYVHGKIDEEELKRRARAEIAGMQHQD